MVPLDKKTEDRNGGKNGNAAEVHGEHDDSCRCRETSEMTPQQLLGRMLSDLAFWKKEKKE